MPLPPPPPPPDRSGAGDGLIFATTMDERVRSSSWPALAATLLSQPSKRKLPWDAN